MKCDIAIIGGGIVGSSIAYHLARDGRAGDIIVVERDPTYEFAATPRGAGGIRQLFSLPENISMAQYGLKFYEGFAETMAVGGQAADIGFKRQGYIFLSDAGGSEQMVKNYEFQIKSGVNAELLDRGALSHRFPSIKTDTVDLAVYSPDDSWIDPYAALQGFRQKAGELGVTFVKDEVTGVEQDDTALSGVTLADGETISAECFVNACGAWAAEFAAMMGLSLPVEPMSRETYFFKCAEKLEPLPFIKTESDVAFRPEGDGYTGGMPDWSVRSGWDFEISQNRFEEVVWPAIAALVPAMNNLKLERSWRGHYARSILDYSAIIGCAGAGFENVFLANGFSGHGIMHAPATGLALSELILDGEFSTIDITRFGYQRIKENAPYRENGIV